MINIYIQLMAYVPSVCPRLTKVIHEFTDSLEHMKTERPMLTDWMSNPIET
jgi:hypothetical protein